MPSEKPFPLPKIDAALEALANKGWHYSKDDPQTNRPMTRVTAKSAQIVKDPYTFGLRGMVLRLYAKDGASYTFVHYQQSLVRRRLRRHEVRKTRSPSS